MLVSPDSRSSYVLFSPSSGDRLGLRVGRISVRMFTRFLAERVVRQSCDLLSFASKLLPEQQLLGVTVELSRRVGCEAEILSKVWSSLSSDSFVSDWLRFLTDEFRASLGSCGKGCLFFNKSEVFMRASSRAGEVGDGFWRVYRRLKGNIQKHSGQSVTNVQHYLDRDDMVDIILCPIYLFGRLSLPRWDKHWPILQTAAILSHHRITRPSRWD